MYPHLGNLGLGSKLFSRIVCAVFALVLCVPVAQAQTYSPPPPSIGSWTGLYFGAGVSVTKSKLSFPGGSGQIRITDTTAPGVSDFADGVPLNKNLFADGFFLSGGLRYQVSRFVFGADYDHNFGSKNSIAPHAGQQDGIGGVFTTGNFVNLGLNSFGGFEQISHFRGVAGYSVSPTIMLFGAAGVAKARFTETGVSASGAVASSPSAPLVGLSIATSTPVEKYGLSLGFGADVKITDNLIARLEYIYDRYNVPASGTAAFAGTIGEITVIQSASTGSGPRYEINTIRGSLNYRIGPSDGSSQIAALTSKDAYGKWGGFYLGGGATYARNRTQSNGIDSLRITDTNTGQVVLSRAGRPTRDGEDNFGHLIAGYLHQTSRYVLGWEYSHTFDGKFDYSRPTFDPGTLTGVNFISPPGAAQCGVYVPNHFSCVGATFFAGFKATDHLRAIAGYEVLPSLMVFGAAGVMRGVGENHAISTSGLVAASPSAPLVGKATVFNPVSKTVYGASFGGGAQFKVTEDVSLRMEYLRDTATMRIPTTQPVSFGGTIQNQTTNSGMTSGDKLKFINESWRGSVIYKF